MNSVKTIIEKTKNYLTSNQNKKPLLFLFVGFLGMLLITISEILPEREEITYETPYYEIYEQEKLLETRLEDAISKIEGAGKTDVTITFESSKKYCYAENSYEDSNESETSAENELVIIEGNNGEEAILIKTNEAKIRGVLVVCEGGNDTLLKEKIIVSVSALLNIPSNKVNVAKMA